MSESSDESGGLDAAVLERAGAMLDAKLEGSELEGGRRHFVEGLQVLDDGSLEEAAGRFRRAARQCDPPFDALARVARGECERARGNIGIALRDWRDVAEDETAPVATRYMAWLSVAAVARDRSDAQLLDRAREAIDRLETSEEV